MKPQLVPDGPKAPDLDVLLAAMQEAMAPVERGDQGFTVTELCDKLGLGRDRVCRMLLTLQRQGQLVQGRRYAMNLGGRYAPVPVYRLK